MNVPCRFLKIAVNLNNFKLVKNIPRHCAANRFYSRDAEHRRPSKVYAPDGESEWIPENQDTKNYKVKQLRLKRDRRVIELDKDDIKQNSLKVSENADLDDDEEQSDLENDDQSELEGTNFTRLSHNQLSHFVECITRTQAKRQRDKSNLIMLEGKRLIQDAILAGVIPQEIYFSRKNLVEDLTMPPGVVKLFQMPYRNMKLYSSVKTPPGIVAFCKMPKHSRNAKTADKSLPISIICDNIRDPGNLGGIIRTVAGVGCSDLILTEGCTDPWNPNVLRAGSGAHFRINIKTGVPWSEMSLHIPSDSKVFLADSCANTEELDFKEDILPLVPYYSVDFVSLGNQIVIVVGGETHGLSSEAQLMARYRDGIRINIPLENDIDSLSVNAAISSILFEIKRQFVMKDSDNEVNAFTT